MDWDDLDGELRYWAEQGRTATLWWRDDDAREVTESLRRLLALSTASRTPVGLAVIPRDAAPDLDAAVAGCPGAWPLLHGWGHVDHAPAGTHWDEYPAKRPRAERLAELARGRSRLAGMPRFVPALVPPWNRSPDDLLDALPGIGLGGVSGWGARPKAEAAPGVRIGNVHVDPIDWQRGGFIGVDAALGQLINHLSARRLGHVDPDEPTGLMTHHPVHDEACWWFLGVLFHRAHAHPGVRWLTPAEVFGG